MRLPSSRRSVSRTIVVVGLHSTSNRAGHVTSVVHHPAVGIGSSFQ